MRVAEFFIDRVYCAKQPLICSVMFTTGEIRPGHLVFASGREIYLGKVVDVSGSDEEQVVIISTRDQVYQLGVDFFVTDMFETRTECT